jgi:hypothetical protein
MGFSSWLRHWIPSRTARSRRPQEPARKRSAFRPQLEALEDRWLPSTLPVTNTNDSGAGSLRAEIAAAQSGDVIDLSNLSGQTITLTSGGLAINKNLTIQGPSARVTIQEVPQSVPDTTLFTVYGATTNVTLSNLNLTGGGGITSNLAVSQGGAVWNGGWLTLTNCDLNNNKALDYGGAIYNAGTLSVQGCTLDNNSAGATPSFDGPNDNGEGGAIYNAGTLTVSNSTLDNNVVNGFGGAGYGGLGGAIANVYRGSATITDTTLSGNSAFGGYSVYAVVGGGIYNNGKMTLNRCTVSGNTTNGGNAIPEGGGIFNDGAGFLIIQSSTVRNNWDVSGSFVYADGADVWSLGHLKISSDSVVGGVRSR